LRKTGDSLSEGQKACLRLVAQGMSSKEIAKALDLKPQTVDTYLKGSMSRLGATNRRDAARMLAAAEETQKLGLPMPVVVTPPESPDEWAPAGSAAPRNWARLPPVGGGVHDLNWSQKTHQALMVAVVSTAIVIALALAIAGLLKAFS
jgi:DNA-binding CsgD family transcriptional regulator